MRFCAITNNVYTLLLNWQNGHKCTAKASEPGLEFSKSIPLWTGRSSNKMPAPATYWSRHSSSNYRQIVICIFLWSVKCLLHQKYKARTLIIGQQASGEPDRWLQLVPEHTAGSQLHQSTGFIGRFSRLIPTVNCAVTSNLVQNSVL